MQRQPIAATHPRIDRRMMDWYLEKGNRLHDRAVADVFGRAISAMIVSVRNLSARIGQTHGRSQSGAGLRVKRSVRTPV